MKCCILFVVAVFVIISKTQAFPADLSENPQENGNIRLETDIPDHVRFLLYTQENINEPFEIDMNDIETLVRSPYNSRNPTTFMIHGWKDLHSVGANFVIKTALFQTGQTRNLNFISVDWRINSNFENYTTSRDLCSPTGKVVAQFIDWMNENAKLQFDTLTLYGSSMGAQVSGFAGKNVQRGKIHSIVAMDPALPEFPFSDPRDRLADTDAEYVETIHTNGGGWGFYEPIGQTAFYPNSGKYQPGCGVDPDGMCSHQRAVLYVAESLSSPEENTFQAVKCSELEHVREGKCDQYESILRLGDPQNAHRPRGIYYLETNSESPYARGNADILEKKKQEIKKINIHS